jgi:DNA polymerase-3 subunit gamma/tau
VAQLGFTDETLLSQVVVAIANGDGASLFTLIEQVVTSGHEPRRFANDLLDHLRDLVVVTQVPDAGFFCYYLFLQSE